MVGERSPLLPDVPTTAEAGLAGIDAALMFGLVAPAATPAGIVARLAEAAAAAVRTDPLRSRLVELGYVTIGSGPQEFRMRISSDIAKWTAIIEAGNIKPN
jgi:tripartite-type tricarboxylate transporter receptor subunit TctC